MITADGCWADFRISLAMAEGRPCLYLDRDGVLIEDTGYPHRPEDIVVVGEAVELVRLAGEAGYVTGLVTNQSGIGRGLFDWKAFSRVQDLIDAALRAAGAKLDFVLACPHHAEAVVTQYRQADHAWRKPAPGMLRDAAGRLGLDIERSIMVGDRTSDMDAAAAAGIPRRWLLPGPERRAAPPGATLLRRSDTVPALLALAAQDPSRTQEGRAELRGREPPPGC